MLSWNFLFAEPSGVDIAVNEPSQVPLPPLPTLPSPSPYMALLVLRSFSFGRFLFLRGRLRASSCSCSLIFSSPFRGYAGAGVWVCLIFPRRPARGCSGCVCEWVVVLLHSPVLRFGGAFFVTRDLVCVCVCVCGWHSMEGLK